MKKLRIFSLLASLLLVCGWLSSCVSTPQGAGAQLCLPGLEWGQPMDEALKALDTSLEALSSEDYALDEEYGGGRIRLRDREIFGQKSAEVILTFVTDFYYIDPEKYADRKNGFLCEVRISYPEDADMDAVLAEMKKSFGEPAEKVAIYSTSDNPGSAPKGYTSDENNQYWAGPAISQVVDEAHQKTLRENEEFAAALIPTQSDSSIDDAVWENYLKTPVSTARWSDNYRNDITEALEEQHGISTSPNMVILEGSLAFTLQDNYIDTLRSLQEERASSASQ